MATQVPAEQVAVPDSFPYPSYGEGALSGAQTKFSVVQDRDGAFRMPAQSQDLRLARYQECLRVAEWSLEFLTEKLKQPKHSALTVDQALARFRGNLAADFDLSPKEQEWVLGLLAEQIANSAQR